LPRLAFDRDQIAGNMRRSRAIRYRSDCDHLHYIAGTSHLLYRLGLMNDPAFVDCD